MGFPGGSDGKEPACKVGALGWIPGLERYPGGGHGIPLQYSCLENPLRQTGLVAYSLWGHRRVGHNSVTKHAHTHTCAHISSVQSLSSVRLFVTPWTAAHRASLSITNSWSLPKLIFIMSVMPSNQLILCRPSYLQSFPESWSFQMSQFFPSGGQSTEFQH